MPISSEQSAPTGKYSSFSGIVIRVQPVGDADLILSVLCDGGGKRSLLAKQARKSRKRFGSSFDLFDRGSFEIAQGRGSLPLVQSFIPLKGFRKLRESLTKLSLASRLCESFDLLVHEDAGTDDEHFPMLVAAVSKIEEAATLRDEFRGAFEALAELLHCSGYLDRSAYQTPSSNALRSLIVQIELHAERRLRSKEMVLTLLESVKKSPEKLAD